MRHLLSLILLLLPAAAGCRSTEPPASPVDARLTAEEVALAISGSESFSEPIWLEVWGHARGPTARALEASGMLAYDDRRDRLVPTPRATAGRFRETFFQDDHPVYLFPVGRRELIAVRTIDDPATAFTRVEFDYRTMLTPLGVDVEREGGRTTLDPALTLHGTALLDRDPSGLRVALIDL